MAFNLQYPKIKDWRKPYYGSKAFDKTCRNHGDCPVCESNRLRKRKVIELAIKEQLKEVI